MISIIIIGRNEADNLKDSIRSIRELVLSNNLSGIEVLYIDSDSADNSIDIAIRNNVDRIIKLEGYYNAAVARNVGARYAQNDLLFFIDGDMILENFDLTRFKESVNEKNIVTGNLVEKLVNDEGEVFKSYIRNYPPNLCGGIFMVYKSSYFKIGGMDEKMTKGQDYDFFIQGLKYGITLDVIDEVICEHFTEPYKSKNRIRQSSQLHSKYRAYLFRKNLMSFLSLKLISREYYPILISSLLLTVGILGESILFLLIAGSFFLMGCIWKSRQQMSLLSLTYEVIKEVIFVKSIFSFYPGETEKDIIVIK